MKFYGLVEALIIALCVGASCAFMLRSYAPRIWARGVDALAVLLPASMRPTERGVAAGGRERGGCSTCNSCGGCGTAKRPDA